MTTRTVHYPSPLTDCLLQEICCPPDTTGRDSSHTSSLVLCCRYAFSCSDNMVECPLHTFESPATVGGGCCAVGLRCASKLCFEYRCTTLAVCQPLSFHNSTSFNFPDLYDCIISATRGLVQASSPPSSHSIDNVVPASASHNCQPENTIQKGQDLSISDSILGTPTAWRAKLGEIAVKSQAEDNWDGKNGGKRRLRRLGYVVIGLLVITVVMFVF